MTETRRQTLRELMRRLDEVRGMADDGRRATPVEADDTPSLIRVVGELVEELERSHRRLIETNVQLVSLREVASSMATTHDAGETSRTVSRYLAHAFGFEEAFLLLLDRERGVLEGAWTHAAGGKEQATMIEVPVRGDTGAVARSLWLNRPLVIRDPERHPPLVLPDGHPLADTLGQIGSFACVPLQRSQALVPARDAHELCGARCVLGDAALLAPPADADAARWALERDERQEHCLACEVMPLLGVIGIARHAGRDPLGPHDLHPLESIALSVAPVIENARLYQDLRRSERSRLHILDSMASALVAVNMKGEILTFNRAAEQLLGAREDEVRGQPFGARFGAEGERLLRATLEQGREFLREEAVLRTRDGVPLPVSLTTSLLRDDKRAVYGAIATFVDLTPLRRAEEHARSQDRLAALGRFTSSVAHEIRNPLTGIGAGVQYLARGLQADGPQHEHLTFIQSEIKRLDRIVQDLFDITHPRSLQLRAAPLEEAAHRALQVLEPVLSERGIQATLEVVPMTPAAAHDADQIQQVFINLIKNAAEASPQGGPLRIAIGPAPRGRGRREPPAVAVRVEDRGSGIAPEHLKTIFEPFFTTKAGGTGLGLYICHDIVKRHGGTLTVQSEPGRGTSFVLELPLESGGGGT